MITARSYFAAYGNEMIASNLFLHTEFLVFNQVGEIR